MRFLERRQRFLVLPVVVVIALLVAGIGVYAGFTSSTNAVTHTFSTGTLALDVGATGGQSNRLDVDATDETPGDSVQRSVDLVNSGSIDLASITLTTTASPSSILDTDTTDGLQFAIDRCSNAWTESGTSPNFSYTCSGATDTVLASRPVIGADLSLDNLTAVDGGNTDHLRVTFTLPATADNSFEAKTSGIRLVFTGH
jgi:spore coat-associated protein N